MTVCNAKGIILFVSGGYTPKLHDGSYLSMHRENIIRMFGGATAIGDNHFSRGRQLFGREITFHCNYAIKKATDPPPLDDQEYAKAETVAAKQSYNTEHSDMRARVESPYGTLKIKWKSLADPFREDSIQHNYLVHIAAAAFNWIKRHPE